MFCYQQSVTKGQPKPLTKAIWDNLIDSPEVSNICRRIAALDPTAEDYNDRKQALKRRLPIIIPHAASFKNGKRISADAIPSGLAMLDVDHVDNPRDWFEKNVQCQIANLTRFIWSPSPPQVTASASSVKECLRLLARK